MTLFHFIEKVPEAQRDPKMPQIQHTNAHQFDVKDHVPSYHVTLPLDLSGAIKNNSNLELQTRL